MIRVKNIKNLGRTLGSIPQEQWEDVAKKIISDSTQSPKLLGHLFPRSASYFRKGSRPDQLSLEQEMVWAAILCKLHSKELNKFVADRQAVDASILESNLDEALERISLVEASIGLSYWLVETKVGILALKNDQQAQSEYFQKLSYDQRTAPLLVNVLIGACWLRGIIDANENSYLEIVRSIEVQIEKKSNRDARYFRFKSALWSLREEDLKDLSPILNGEANSPLIDRYLTLLRVCGFLIALGREDLYPVILRVLNILQTIDNQEQEQFRSFLSSSDQYCGMGSTTFGNYANGNYRDAVSELSHKLTSEKGLLAKHLIQSEVLAAASGDQKGDGKNLRDKICIQFQEMLSRDSLYKGKLEDLKRLTRRFSSSSWSATLASRVRAEDEVETPWHATQFNSRLYSIYLPFGDHIRIRYCPDNLFDILAGKLETLSPLYKIEILIRLGKSPDKELLNSAISDLSYRSYKKAWWDYSIGDLSSARRGFSLLCDDENKNIRVKSRIFYLQLSVQDYIEFVLRGSYYFLENNSILQAIDCDDFLTGYQNFYEANELRAKPELSIFLHMYDKSNGLARKREVADAIDDLVLSHGLDSPLKLSKDLFTSDLMRKFFLSEVCIPDNREGSVHLPTQESVYQERMKICDELVQIDPSNEKKYRSENLALIELLGVRKFLAKYNGAKIYVDEKNIRRLFEVDGVEYFNSIRHQSKLFPEKLEIFDGTKKEASLSMGGNVDFYLLHKPYAAMGEFFYLEKRFGLNTSLSVFIKHGIIDGKIKSSMSRNGLTHRSLNDTLMKFDFELDIDIVKKLSQCIVKFSASVENQIKELKSTIIHAKSESNPNGLLDYSSDMSSAIVTTHIVLMSKALNDRITFDDFCAILINQHWERTAISLKLIRNYLSEIFKKRIQSCFDDLMADVARNCPVAIGVIKNQVTAAKVDWSRDLEEIISWFEKGKAYAYEDFMLSRVIQAALENTKSLYPDVIFDLEMRNSSTRNFIGSCFSSLLTIINLLFENIVSYSGSRTPYVKLDAEDRGGALWLRIENQIPLISEYDLINRRQYLVELLESLKNGEFYIKLDHDKKSGIPKIKKLITSDLNCDVEIVADYLSDNKFYIELLISGW